MFLFTFAVKVFYFMIDKLFHRSDGQAMDETEYIISSSSMVDILHEGEEEIKNSHFKVTSQDEIWAEVT